MRCHVPRDEHGRTAPRYRKYIKANNDGTYDLSLNVTGTQSGSSQTTVSPADIVVVFDTSSSMSGSMGHNSRLEVAKTAVNSMAQHLLTSENQGKGSNIRMALGPLLDGRRANVLTSPTTQWT